MKQLVLERGPEIRRRILAVTVAGIPVFFLRVGSDPFNVPKLAFLIVALSLVGAIRAIELLQGGAAASNFRRLAIPALALGVPLIISWVFAAHRYWSLFGLFARFQGFIPYLLVIALGIAVADAFAGYLDELAWAFVWSGAIIGAYAVIQTVGLDPFSWALSSAKATQAISTLGNPNFTGGILGMALPFAVGMWYARPDRQRTLMKLLPLIVLGWLFARSEGGWAAGVAGTGLVLGVVYSERWARARLLSLVSVAGVILVVLGTVLVTIVKPDANIPFTAEERGQWWVAAFDMGMDSPIFGQGPNAFAVEGIQYRTERDAIVQGFNYTDDPHSVPLSLFSGWGLLGVLGYCVLIWWVIQRAGDEMDLVGWLFVAGPVAYFVQSFVSIDELSLRAFLWASLGGLAVATVPAPAAERGQASKKKQSSKNARSRSQAALQRLPAVVGVIILALLPILWSVLFIKADGSFQHGVKLYQAGAAIDGAAAMRSALSFRDEYRYRHLYGFNLGNSAIPIAGRDRIEEMRRIFSFTQSFPDLPAIRDEARLLHEFAPGDVELNKESLALYERALTIDPHNHLLRLEATLVAVAAEDHATAMAIGSPLLDEADPGLALRLLEPLAEAAEGKGDLALALDYRKQQIDLDPQVSGYREQAAILAVKLGEHRFAIETTESVLSADTSATVWGARALAFVGLGRVDEARAAIVAALGLDPDQRMAIEAREALAKRK